MAPSARILMALSLALLLAGAIGAGIHSPHRSGTPLSGPSTSTAPGTTKPGPATTASSTTVAGPPPPGSASLAAGLVRPTDMGGYYRTDPAAAAAFIDSAPCLAALQPSPAQRGRAAVALLGPNGHSVPTIIEEVASYPGGEPAAVYHSVVSALDACSSSLSFGFGNTGVTSHIGLSSIAPVGDADRVWSGTFSLAGSSFTIQIGIVLDGADVLSVVWIDTVPTSDPIMGNFTSTVSLAIGKLA